MASSFSCPKKFSMAALSRQLPDWDIEAVIALFWASKKYACEQYGLPSVADFCFESLRNSPWNFLAVHSPSPVGQYRQPDTVSCAVGLLIYVIPTHPPVDKLVPRLQCVLPSGSPIAPQWYDRSSVLPKTVALLPLLSPHYSAQFLFFLT